MKHIWYFSFSAERERRLTMFNGFEGPNGPEEEIVKKHDDTSWQQWGGEKLGYVAGGVAEFAKGVMEDLPYGFVQKFSESFEKDSMEKFILQAKQSTEVMPALRTPLRHIHVDDFETPKDAQQFLDVGNWLTVFEQAPALFQEEAPDVGLPERYHHIHKVLLRLSLAERRALFQEAMQNMIPPGVREKNEETFGSLQHGEQLKPENVEQMSRISAGILGEKLPTDFPSDSEDVALIKEALQEKVFPEGTEGVHQTHAMHQDYLHTVRNLGYEHLQNGPTDPQILLQAAEPSVFRGALAYGILPQETLEEWREESADVIAEQEKTAGVISKNLDNLTNETTARLREEGETYTEIWRNMNGFQKLAMAGIALALLWNKKTRGLAIGMGAAYFGDKFLLKGEGSRLLGAVTDKVTGTVGDYNDKLMANMGLEDYTTAVSERAPVVMEFLNEYDTVDLETEGTAFGLLNQMPLSVLSKSVSFTPEPTLDTQGNSPLMVSLQNTAKQREWSPRYRAFLREEANNKEVAEALSYVFYNVAAEDPGNQSLVEQVEQARGDELLTGSNYADLLHTADDSEAKQAYRTLVERGRRMAEGQDRTLGDLMQKYVLREEQAAENALEQEVPSISHADSEWLRGLQDRDITKPDEALTEADEQRIAELMPHLTADFRKMVQEIMKKQFEIIFNPDDDIESADIPRLTVFLQVLPKGPSRQLLFKVLQSHLLASKDLSDALVIANIRDNTEGQSREQVQSLLNVTVRAKLQEVVAEMQKADIGNVQDHPKYAEWVQQAEELYILTSPTPDGHTDTVSLLLEYLLYQGEYEGADEYEKHLNKVAERHGLDRPLQVSDAEVPGSSLLAMDNIPAANRLSRPMVGSGYDVTSGVLKKVVNRLDALNNR